MCLQGAIIVADRSKCNHGVPLCWHDDPVPIFDLNNLLQPFVVFDVFKLTFLLSNEVDIVVESFDFKVNYNLLIGSDSSEEPLIWHNVILAVPSLSCGGGNIEGPLKLFGYPLVSLFNSYLDVILVARALRTLFSSAQEMLQDRVRNRVLVSTVHVVHVAFAKVTLLVGIRMAAERISPLVLKQALPTTVVEALVAVVVDEVLLLGQHSLDPKNNRPHLANLSQ